MQDCVSLANSYTVLLGWVTWSGMIVVLGWMILRRKAKSVVGAMLFVVAAHPILWGRLSDPCQTELHVSLSIFLGLGLVVFVWSTIRPRFEEERQ